MKPEVMPIYALIDYAWAVLKANTTMKESDYGGRIPIIPSSQQPEFTDLNKPFIVYTWSENEAYDVYCIRSGQAAFAVYSTSDRELTRIANILKVALNKWDDTAEEINRWKNGGVFNDITFLSVWTSMLDGPSPENVEGGRQNTVLMVRYRYIAEYDLVLP